MEIVQSFSPINTAGLLKERKRSAEASHSGSWGSTDTEDLSSNFTLTLDDPRMTPNVLLSLLLQTHVNPCFVQSSPGDAPRPLQRDSWHLLQHGDLFSLLPGDLVFRVAAEGGEENGDGDGSVTPRCGGGGRRYNEGEEQHKEEEETVLSRLMKLVDAYGWGSVVDHLTR